MTCYYSCDLNTGNYVRIRRRYGNTFYVATESTALAGFSSMMPRTETAARSKVHKKGKLRSGQEVAKKR